MATIMRAFKAAPRHLPHGTATGSGGSFMRSAKAMVVDKGERYGAAAGFAFAKGFYQDKFIWRGHGADLWLGGGAMVIATLLEAASGGRSTLAPHLERLADAGLMSAIASRAAAYGFEKAGHQVAVLPAGKKVHGVIGAVPGAKKGPFLSPEEIANFASRR